MKENIQLDHSDHQPSNKKFPLSIIANDISSPLNVGSLFRLSDALGIEKLYLCGNTSVPPNSKITKTSRATEKYVDYETHNSAVELISKLKSNRCTVIALEITASSLSINSDKLKNILSNDNHVYLIIGSENTGVHEDLLALSNATTHIPMLGNNSSMNVVVATAIACHEITKNMA